MKWFAKKNSLEELRQLRRSFEHISLKISTGSTLDATLRGQHQILFISKSIAKQWSWIRAAIFAGKIPAKAGVDAFAQLLDTHYLCRSEMKKRGLNSKIQSRVLGTVSLCMIVIIAFLMDAPLLSLTNALALSLCGAGFAVLNFVQKNVQKHLWRLEWLMLWFYVGTMIEWGMTPAQAFAQSLEWCQLSSAVPAFLRQESMRLAEHLRSGDVYRPDQTTALPKSLDAIDVDIMEHFQNSVSDGLQSSKVVKSYGQLYQRWVQDTLQAKADASAYLNLIPLYLCFAPAIFLVLFGQIASLIVAETP